MQELPSSRINANIANISSVFYKEYLELANKIPSGKVDRIEFNSGAFTGTMWDINTLIEKCLDRNPHKVYSLLHHKFFYFNNGKYDDLIIDVYYECENNNKNDQVTERKLDFTFIGESSSVFEAYQKIKVGFPFSDKASLNWMILDSSGQIESFDMNFSCPHGINDSYYPFVKNGVLKYFEDYINISSPILVLLGDPGTGKTSFIRSFISKYNRKTMVTYDEKLMCQDQLFIRFLQEHYNLLVLEDSETLLTPRETQNTVVPKILNASDGLVKIPDKKIIFTANITNVNKIDQALLRPGRCFDVLHFRKLTYEEALLASKDAGKELSNEGEYSLAEIFSGKKQETHTKKKFGF